MNKINKVGIGDTIKWLWDLGYSGDRIATMTGGVITGRSVLRYLNRCGIQTTDTRKLVECENCGVEFRKQRSVFRNSRLHFCCMPCYHAHLKNPDYIRSTLGSREARKIVRECGFMIQPIEVVHHEDSDTTNNEPSNLMVFANHGDHMRWHRGDRDLVKPLWSGVA